MPFGRILPPWGWVWHRILDRLPGRSTSQYSIYHSRFVLDYVRCSLQQTNLTCQDARPLRRSFALFRAPFTAMPSRSLRGGTGEH